LNEQELAYACQSIRQSGYLRQDSRQAYGVTDLSAPILGSSDHAIAVLTCPYMRRIDAHMAPTVDKVVAALLRTADHLSIPQHTSC
ncbi:IclR family transcriptional regulator, partial [Burkholderia seminalis]|nr:IclR family transcriptional regulator [Burkholderia seminalis]